jgi:hypothetical protein
MQHFTVFGYARSKMTDEELRNMISMTLTCRIDQRYPLTYFHVWCLAIMLCKLSVLSLLVEYLILRLPLGVN